MNRPMYFTPSEVVLLNGDRFVQSAGLVNKYTVRASGQGVNANKLAVAVWSAALLANEQYGLIRLTPGINKSLFGLVKQLTLMVDLTNVQAGWPAGTLEAELLDVTRRLQPSNSHNLHKIVYDWLGSDDSAPYQKVLQMVEQGLGQRGLMVEVDAKALGIFKYKKLELPESTRPLIAQQPFAPVQQLLQNCEQFRPDIWNVMQKNIDKGISAHQEQADTSTD